MWPTAETPSFLVYGRDSNIHLHQLVEPMQWFLGDPDSRHLDLKAYCLALAIAKKTLDENQFKHAQKTTNHTHPISKLLTEYPLKKQPGKWDLKWRTGYRIVCIECNWHYLYIGNQTTGKTRPSMWKMLYMNLQLSYGMLTQCLVELENS